jgi:hypothetical protein
MPREERTPASGKLISRLANTIRRLALSPSGSRIEIPIAFPATHVQSAQEIARRILTAWEHSSVKRGHRQIRWLPFPDAWERDQLNGDTARTRFQAQLRLLGVGDPRKRRLLGAADL